MFLIWIHRVWYHLELSANSDLSSINDRSLTAGQDMAYLGPRDDVDAVVSALESMAIPMKKFTRLKRRSFLSSPIFSTRQSILVNAEAQAEDDNMTVEK